MNVKQEIISNYSKWYRYNSLMAGGLVTPAIAAKILNITMVRLNQIWKNREFKKYVFDDEKKPLLSMTDVLIIEEERTEKENTVMTTTDEETGYTINIIMHDKKEESITWNKKELEKVKETLKESISYVDQQIENLGR